MAWPAQGLIGAVYSTSALGVQRTHRIKPNQPSHGHKLCTAPEGLGSGALPQAQWGRHHAQQLALGTPGGRGIHKMQLRTA